MSQYTQSTFLIQIVQKILVAIPFLIISIIIINSDGTKSILKVDPCVFSVFALLC